MNHISLHLNIFNNTYVKQSLYCLLEISCLFLENNFNNYFGLFYRFIVHVWKFFLMDLDSSKMRKSLSGNRTSRNRDEMLLERLLEKHRLCQRISFIHEFFFFSGTVRITCYGRIGEVPSKSIFYRGIISFIRPGNF